MAQQRYLLVPMQPTPNGRMHVGHGGGTYLRADVLARALKVRGHDVRVISGSDAYENWVVAEAKRIGRTVDDACDLYHAGILRDLQAIGVELDVWIDPRSAEHTDAYREVHEQALAALQRTGAAELEAERIPYSVDTGAEMMGTWIAGDCPNCGTASGGSSCVVCGEHFQPEELRNPRSRLDNSPLEWREKKHWFVRPSDAARVVSGLADSGLRGVFADAPARYLETRGGRVRLSAQGTWGVRSAMVADDAVLSNGYYLYSVYCGEVYRKLEGNSTNAFAPDSGVFTIGLFGNDNSTPGLIAPHAIAQGSGGALKPFDAVVVNGMLNFEGQKCSTSKRHGIWLSELLDNVDVTSDELRYALAQAALDDDKDDITIQGLVDRVTSLRRWNAEVLQPRLGLLRAGGTSAVWTEALEKALAEQSEVLDPCHIDLPQAVRGLGEWLRAQAPAVADWLLGVAVLAEPLLPDLAGQVWQQLGYEGRPRAERARGPLVVPVREVRVTTQSRTDLSVEEIVPYAHLAERG